MQGDKRRVIGGVKYIARTDVLLLKMIEYLYNAFGIEILHHHRGFLHGFKALLGFTNIRCPEIDKGEFFNDAADIGKNGVVMKSESVVFVKIEGLLPFDEVAKMKRR